MNLILTLLCCFYFLNGVAQQPSHVVLWPTGIDRSQGIREHFVYGLIEANNGDVLAFAEGRLERGDAGPHHIVLKRSQDGGEHWLASQIIVYSANGASYANPTPVMDRVSGTIFLFYAQNFRNDSSRLFYITSTDAGKTWSTATEITHLMQSDPFSRPFHLPGPGHGITLDNGRMVLQIWHRYAISKPVPERQYGVSVIYSDDHGHQWKAGGYLPGTQEFTANESRMMNMGGAAIRLNARLSEPGTLTDRAVSISTNGGITWSYPIRSQLPQFIAVDAGFTAFLFQGKRYILCTRPLGPGRTNLGISYSVDSGRSWSNPVLLYKGAANYSDVTVLADGTILIVYGRGKPRHAAVVKVRPEWLIESDKS